MSTLTETDMMSDSIASQKLVGRNYYIFSDECVNPNLKMDFLSIAREESDITSQLFKEMETRGWVKTDPADMNKLSQAYQKFSTCLPGV